MRNHSKEISFSSNSSSRFSFDHNSTSPPPLSTTNIHPSENVFVPKKPRGRKPGSKNKPKSTSISLKTQTVVSCSKIVKVDVTPGRNIIDSIVDVAQRDHVSLTILHATGTITNVILRTSPHSATLNLKGPFTLLSLTGSYIYKNKYTLQPGATPPLLLSFGINLCSSEGQVFGGPVADTVIAGENVNLILSTFTNPKIYNDFYEAEEKDNDYDNNN